MSNTIPATIKKALEKGNYEKALILIEKSIDKDKENSNLYVLKGNVYARLEKEKEAINAFDMALKINTGEIGAYNGKGLVYFCMKENEKGMEQVKRGIIVANFLDKNPNSSNREISTYLEVATRPPQEIDEIESIKPIEPIKPIKPLASIKVPPAVKRKVEPIKPVKPIKSLAPIEEIPIVQRKAEPKPKTTPRFCSKCGTELRSGCNFCPKCGAKIKLK